METLSVEAWCALHKKQGEKGRCWLYSCHTFTDRFPLDTVCPQLNDTAFVHCLHFFFLNLFLTWGCHPPVPVWFIILPPTFPWFQPQCVALFLLVIKDIITVHCFFPCKYVKTHFKSVYGFLALPLLKERCSNNKNIWSDCGVYLHVSYLYLLILSRLCFKFCPSDMCREENAVCI